jgi:hypothetical protein
MKKWNAHFTLTGQNLQHPAREKTVIIMLSRRNRYGQQALPQSFNQFLEFIIYLALLLANNSHHSRMHNDQ